MGMLYLLSAVLCMRPIREDPYASYNYSRYNPWNSSYHHKSEKLGQLYVRRENKFFKTYTYKSTPRSEDKVFLSEIITDYQIRYKILENTHHAVNNEMMNELSTIFDMICKLYIRKNYQAVDLNTFNKAVKRVLDCAEKFYEHETVETKNKLVHALNDLKYDLTDLAFNKFSKGAKIRVYNKPRCKLSGMDEDLIYCVDNHFYRLVNLYWAYVNDPNYSIMMERNMVAFG